MIRDERELTLVLNRLEKLIEDVRTAYQRYFDGLERREPIKERQKLKTAIRKVIDVYTGNTQLKFRMQALVARFNTYSNLWDRVVSQIDSGTYRPDQFKANLRVGPKPTATGAGNKKKPIKSDDELESVYHTFIQTRQQTGESTNISYEKFSQLVQKQKPGLEAKLGGRDVSFKVVVENGKTKLKGFSRK